MYRFYCEEGSAKDGKLALAGGDVNHIKHVLRMRAGERLIACDGNGKEYVCSIESLEAERIVLAIEEERQSESELPVRITLYQGLPKKDKMELVIQKAVELGAACIVPVTMKRCVVKLEEEKKEEKKRERWQAISMSAAKQSGRGIIPNIEKTVSYQKALKDAAARGIVLVPYERAEGMGTLKNAIKELTVKLEKTGTSSKPPLELSLLIGPEGGFEEEEISAAIASGAVPVSLGKRILRTETAGLAALSILMYEIECTQSPKTMEGAS